MMIERGLSVDHVTIWRWVQHYAPILNGRIQREMRHPNRSWRVDETYIRVTGVWTYLYRAVDSDGDTIDFMLSPKRALTAAKLFAPGVLQAGLGTSAGHQCGWAPSICPCNRQPEVLGRTWPAVPQSAITLFKGSSEEIVGRFRLGQLAK